MIATLIHHPSFYFHCESLRPNHFIDRQNAYIYWALGELAKRGIESIDAYNISNILASNEAAKKQMEAVPLEAIHELIDVSHLIARSSPEDYILVAENVVEAAFRRTVQKKLERCAALCGNLSADIRKEIYTLDSAMMEFATTNDVPQFKDVVESIWEEIEQRQGGSTGIPFKFPTLNHYATIDRGELVSATDDHGLAQINRCNFEWLQAELGPIDFYDPIQNVRASLRILGPLWEKYDPHKALMAYNYGEGGARRHWNNGQTTSRYSREVLTQAESYGWSVANEHIKMKG